MNILIGPISSYKAIVIASHITSYYPKHTIITFDFKYFSKFIITKYSHKHFVINRYNFIAEILLIIEKNNIDIFFPVINSSLKKIWEQSYIFGKTLSYLGDFSSFEILNNKASLHKLANKLEIKVPKVFSTIEYAEIPFIVKPTNLSSAKGIKYYFEKPEFIKIDTKQNLIIQEYVKGIGVGYSFYSKNGIIFNGYGHKRLAEYPISGGSSTYRDYYVNDKMHDVASKIVKNINYTGFAMFEFKLTEQNELYLIEVNPRIWGSINQGLANGNNYFEQILGPSKLKNSNVNNNIKTYVAPLVYLSFFKYLIKLNIAPIIYFIKNIKFNKADISIFSDPFGYLSTIFRKII